MMKLDIDAYKFRTARLGDRWPAHRLLLDPPGLSGLDLIAGAIDRDTAAA